MAKTFIKGASKSLAGLVVGATVRYKKTDHYMNIEAAPDKNEAVTISGIYTGHVRFTEYPNLRVRMEDFSANFIIMGDEDEQGDQQ